jgi:hypothetical protein
MSDDSPDVPGLSPLFDPEVLAELERTRAELESVINSPSSRAIRDSHKDFLNSPAAKAVQAAADSAKALGLALKFDPKKFELRTHDFPSLADLAPPADVQAVGVLHQVHAELQGMAAILNVSRQQTAAMVQVTQANLTAVQAVIAELRETRASQDRSSRVLSGLTVALLIAAFVAAIAVIPEFVKQVIQAWSWLATHV